MANSLKNKFKYSALAALIVTLLSCTVMAFTGVGFGAPAETANAETQVSAQSNAELAAAWNSVVENNGTFTLTENWNAAADSAHTTSFGTGTGFSNGRLYVPAGKSVVIDLNGHSINRSLTSAVADGGVIYVEGALEIKDSVDSGTITGGYTNTKGGGIYVASTGTLIFSAGSIYSNQCSPDTPATIYGGGVYVDGGTFKMNGGSITENNLTPKGPPAYGCAVYVGNGGTFTLNNGIISKNNSGGYGSVYVSNSTFEMNGGQITENEHSASSYGGGVSVVSSTFIMRNGIISNNTASLGGGVYVSGSGTTFTMYGGEITGNSCIFTIGPPRFGGGVYVGAGRFEMYGGTISDNQTNNYGGGVGITGNGIFTIFDGEITGNTATYGGGVLVYDSSSTTASTFQRVGGTVSGNSAGIGDNVAYYGYGSCWSAAVNYSTTYSEKVGFVLPSNWTAEASDAGFGTGVGFGDVGYLLVPAGANIVMDLNGHTLNRNKPGIMDGYAIGVKGNLTITSATKSNAGTITGCKGGYGGAVLVLGGNLTLDYGTISGNGGSTSDGAGVYVCPYSSNKGTFTMNGGVISGNEGFGRGGGVYVYNSTFTMNGGEISGNYVSDNGGGVYVCGSKGSFDMYGGTISGNEAANDGGGVYIDSDATFTMYGGEISGNTAKRGSGVYSYKGFTMMYGGEVKGNSAEGVYIYGGTFTLNDGTISENGKNGIFAAFSSNIVMNGGEVSDNKSTGLWSSSGKITITGGIISGNTASAYGGGVSTDGGTVTMTGGTISGNTAMGGGGIFVGTNSTISITGGTITNNTATYGGGIYLDTNAITEISISVASGVISGNTASKTGNEIVIFGNWGNGWNLAVEFSLAHPEYEVAFALFNIWAADSSTHSLGTGTGFSNGRIYVPEGANIILDLNGQTINRGLTSYTEAGSVFYVNGTLEMTDTSDTKAGKITGACPDGGSGYWGGGVYVGNGGTFIMTEGTITENRGDYYGGGVYVDNGGAFTMNGGTISKNDAECGGGVYVNAGGTFTMNGGTISGNGVGTHVFVNYGGGVDVNGGTFTMNGGTISGNSADYNGGGVLVEGGSTFTMNGGTITGNNANTYGGGVYVNGGAFIMNGGTISNNTAVESGGGVYVSNGTFTMDGGTISNNIATTCGGVYVNNGTFTMNGGTITGNTANNCGGGVGVFSNSTFTMNAGTITENSAKNNGGGVYVEFSTFTMNGGTISGNTAGYLGGGVSVVASTFEMLGGEISDNTSSNSSGGGVYVSENAKFTMDGGTISNNTALESGGGVLVEGGTFKMTDGTISGNTANSCGGGVVVGNSGTFEMTGGTISGNKAENSGGGVYICSGATFTLYDGTITGNTAPFGGGLEVINSTFEMHDGAITGNTAAAAGGLYVYTSTFTMHGGTISNNTASQNGGGLVVETGSTFTLNGGTISNNIASMCGGGVIVESNGTFTMNGGTISNNTALENGGGIYMAGTFYLAHGIISGNDVDGYANNVYICNGTFIIVTDSLLSDGVFSRIGVTLQTTGHTGEFTAGFNGHNQGYTPNMFFFSDLEGYSVTLTGGEACFKASSVVKTTVQWQYSVDGTNWINLSSPLSSVYYTGAEIKVRTVDLNGNGTLATIVSGGSVCLNVGTYAFAMAHPDYDGVDNPTLTLEILPVEIVWQYSFDNATWYNFTGDSYEYAGMVWFVRAYDVVNNVSVELSTVPSAAVKGTGDYAFAASNGAGNYLNDTFSFKIVQKVLRIEWNFDGALSDGNAYYWIYDSIAHTPVPVIYNAENVQVGNIPLDYKYTCGMNFAVAQATAGAYTLTVSVDDEYITILNGTTSYTIKQKELTVNWIGATDGAYSFDYAPDGYTVDAELVGLIPGEEQKFNIRYTYNNANVETPKAVGVYTATATLVDSVNYFFNDTQAATIRIKTRSLTVEWTGNGEKDGDFLWTFSGNGYAPAAKAFYPAGEEITLTFEYATYVNGRVGSYSSTVPTAAGTYIMRVKLSTAGYNGNEYSFSNNTQVFEIEKLGVTLEWKYDGGELKDGVVRWEYDGQSHNVTPEINGLQIIRDGVLGVNLKVVRTDSASALQNVGYATASAALDTSDSFNNNFYITNDTSLDYEVYKRVITSAVWTDKNGNEYSLGASASYNFGTISGAKGPDFTMVAAGVNGDLSLTVTYSASFDGEWVVDEDNGYVAYAKLSADDAVNYCFEDESDTAELTFYIRAIGQIKDNVTVTWVIFTSPDEYVKVDDFVAEHGGAYLTYNGKAQSPVALYIKDDGSYIELAISANGKGTDVGEYSVWLLPSSEYNYEGDLECAYEIKPLDVTVEWQNSQSDEGKTFTYVYSGKEQAPYATVNAGGINCSVTVEGKINAGSYTATAVVSENFNIVKGETQNYEIKKLGLDTSLITWSAPDCYDERTADGETYYVYLYDGKSYAPEAKITLDALGITLNLSVQGATSEVGTNYAIAMLDGSNEAHANFSLTGEAIKRFDIVQVSVNTVYWKDADGNVSYGDKVLHFVYNGKAQAPTAYFMNGDTEVKLTVIGERTDAGNAIAYVDTKDFDFGGTTPECEFVIDAKPLDVTWSGTSVTFNGKAQSPVAEAEDVELGFTLEAGVDFIVSAFTNAGKYTAKIVFTNKNYTFADGTDTTEFTIEKIDLSEIAEWSFADGDKGEDGIFFIEYNSEARAPEISVEFTLGDQTVTFTFDYSGKVATVGNHTVTATIASATVDGKDIGAANFTLGNNDGIDYKVTPFEITVDWDYGDAKTDADGTRFWEYNGSEHAPTASFTDWNGDKIDLKVYGAETNANATAYTASVVAPENCVIADGADATATFVIKQATIEVVWSGEGATLVDGVYVWTYDGEEHAPVAKIKGTDNELSVTGAATDASDTNYVATAAQSDGNYVIASGETQAFRIKAKTVYVRWYGADDSDDNFEWAYSGYAQGPKAVLCDENNEPILVDGEPVEVEVAGKASTVGTHTALATDTFTNFDFAADAVVQHSFKISPKVLDDFKFAESGATVTDGDDYKIYTYVYSGDDLQPEPTSGYKETVGFKTTIHVLNSDGSLGKEVLAITDVGSYRITAESLNSNFTLPADKATVDVVVTKYQAEVVWSSDELTYNGANQAPTAYFVDAKGNEVSLTVTVDGDHADVGTYEATASFTVANGNYELAENVTTEFEIKAYGLAVEWDWTGWTDQTLVYDGEEHLPTATVSAASNLGLKVAYKVYNSDGDLVEGEIKNAGTYKIVLELSGNGKDNYTFDEKEQTFEIKKKALTITIDDVNVDYGDTAPEYSASFDGFVESEADELGDLANSKIGLWLRCDYASGYAPGEYEIGVVTARLAEILKNYEIPEGITGTLTVNEIAFKVIWNSGNSEIPNYSSTTYNGKEYKPNAYYVDEVMGEHYDLEVKYATYDEATGKYTVIDDEDYKAVDAGTYYLVAIAPDGVTLTGTETSFTIEKLAIEVNISSVDNVTFGSVYTVDGELVHARLTYKFGAVEPVDNIGLVLTLACADGDFDAYGYLNAGEYKIVASWNEADFGKNYEVTFVGEAEGEDGTNSCGLYKLDKAEIKVNKVKDIYSDEEFEEIISIGDGGNWLYINLNETEADENGVRQYKYIDYAGYASAEEEIVSIKYSTLHNLDDHDAPDPKEDDYYTSNPAIRTAGRYAVNYMIEIANHEVYYGTWYVLVVPDSGLVDVTFNKVFEAFYGDEIPENFVKLLIDEEYISVKGYPVDNFVRFAKVTISDGTTNGTADSSTGVGSYTVNIEIDDDDPQVVRIVRFTENSNIGAYVVKPKVITVDWGNTTFTQDKENPDKVWIDELTINISGFVDAQTVTVENIQVSADGGYAYTEIIVTDNGKEVRLILTATGDFKSVGGNTLLLTVEDGNYEIALESSAVAVTVVAPVEPTVPGEPTVKGGAPDWLWWVLAIVAIALIIMIIVIVVLVKRRKEANGDDDGFYEEATEEDQN